MPQMASLFFTVGVIAFVASLILYFMEIILSTRAIGIELSDMDKM